MSVTTSDFTSLMARVPGPVVVATTVDPDGRRWGFTASAFSSLSLSPPLVLLCLAKSASTHAAFVRAERFLVNVLAADQAAVAARFARSGEDRFAAGDMRPYELGLPGLPGAAARAACALDSVLEGGDHSILVGRVLAVTVAEPAPLVHCDRAFARPVPLDQLAVARSR
ncbi:flavin reductase [Actinoplanes sp. SE50]|uniref:flavin reductase family protein n=1 Tax=unclassified Actinoplanes TaxID=2626549 RepID=UPI00023EC5BA|nr:MULTISPECIES: flavin reductase family protein [unclassified Actinoplanes]AEV83075.1 flavin reductase domain-containing protein [Actinoplanes sp. SE50/110]ATO81471.1 flavin reductase [Actinoplanes sp. SE50]SLL98878.1 flavin reductase [Actinoplanes sp. SE50/110]